MELIDSNCNNFAHRTGTGDAENVSNVELIDPATNQPWSGLSIHLPHTKKKRNFGNGQERSSSFQSRCNVCGKKTILQ
jgi:hypothetical protein